MQQTKRIICVLVNLLGTATVFIRYIYGFLTHPNASRVLWSDVPLGLRPLYTTGMLTAAAGYFTLACSILRLDHRETNMFSRIGFRLFHLLYIRTRPTYALDVIRHAGHQPFHHHAPINVEIDRIAAGLGVSW